MASTAELTDWMQQTARGDQQAFRRLATALGQRMFALACRLLNGNRSLAEDAVQDALIKLWQAAPRWQPTGSVAAYACRITYHCCMDMHRAHKPTLALMDDHVEPETITGELQQNQQQRLLWQAMNRLPERQRHALLLFYFEDNSLRDVAQQMHTTEKAVERLIARARQSLAPLLPPELAQGGLS